MSERDDLRDEIAGWPIGTGYYQTAVGVDEAEDIADAILAAGFRRPERVTTAVRLAELPEGTLFRSGDRLGRLWAHSASALDGGHVWADKHDALPLVVLA